MKHGISQNYLGAISTANGLLFGKTEPEGFYSKFVKRPLDVFLVLVASLPALWIVLVFAAMVSLDGRNPFYTQERVGKGGRVYRIWKLRSMVADADKVLETYLAQNPAAAREWNATQKLQCDPRVTAIGRLMRKTSIDELPQLWNVLKGTMSLVGPRPIMVDQRAIYSGTAYYKLRPGITGSWQVSVRHTGAFSVRVQHDENYYRTLCLRSDVTLLLRTFKAVMKCTGV